jgi:hypothetical protein
MLALGTVIPQIAQDSTDRLTDELNALDDEQHRTHNQGTEDHQTEDHSGDDSPKREARGDPHRPHPPAATRPRQPSPDTKIRTFLPR